jgi:hypothetical protein
MTPSKWRDVLPARRLANKMPGRLARDAGKRIFHMAEITPARDECNKSDRRRCRQCRGKLPTPTDIPQYAFCTPFCWQQFYRRRCLVCEEPIRRRAEHQKSCIRRECKNELRRYPHLYQLQKGTQGSRNVVTPLRSADKTGTKNALATNRARIVAPAHVLAVEVFERAWQPAVSSGGVPIEVARLRPRTLVRAAA